MGSIWPQYGPIQYALCRPSGCYRPRCYMYGSIVSGPGPGPIRDTHKGIGNMLSNVCSLLSVKGEPHTANICFTYYNTSFGQIRVRPNPIEIRSNIFKGSHGGTKCAAFMQKSNSEQICPLWPQISGPGPGNLGLTWAS